MKFQLIDKIESVSSQRIVGVKHLSLAEEYLADHFPTFPVMPGVLMLEALTQAAGWLLHYSHDFSCSMAVLKEARNIRYGNFVAPGNWLRLEVDLVKSHDGGAMFKASGSVNGSLAVNGRIEVAYFNLADKAPELVDLDQRLIQHHRRQWELIAPRPGAGVIATGAVGR